MPWVPLPTPTSAEMRDLEKTYSGKVRFLVDENAGPDVAAFLRDGGYNTLYVAEAGLRGHPDENVFAAAWRDQRVIITHDQGFLDDRLFPPHRNPGIVVIDPGSDQRKEDLWRCLVFATWIAGTMKGWYLRKKLHFTSGEAVTVHDADGSRTRFLWKRRKPIMRWDD
jgi:predicted nuclease of predicted toxin-antitoxin system